MPDPINKGQMVFRGKRHQASGPTITQQRMALAPQKRGSLPQAKRQAWGRMAEYSRQRRLARQKKKKRQQVDADEQEKLS